LKIKNNTKRQHNTLFDFKPTDVDTVSKLVNKINIKKATGVDQISSKLLRAGAPVPQILEIGRMQTAYTEECHVADSQKPSKDP
jgi:hypothetical protein